MKSRRVKIGGESLNQKKQERILRALIKKDLYLSQQNDAFVMMKFFRSYKWTRSAVYRFDTLRLYSLHDKKLVPHLFTIFLN